MRDANAERYHSHVCFEDVFFSILRVKNGLLVKGCSFTIFRDSHFFLFFVLLLGL